ncbi:NAD(P)-binding protein [Mycena sp. CBHHK59/15]|nr:NAD(P)-binding protein [Mycena sp. CBHHK59/15]
MTITQDLSAPLVAVVGATGTQGGSVIKALAASDKLYRIRGFTRDAEKKSAQELIRQGVDIVTVSLVLDNVREVYKAFAGANVAFIVTNFWEHLDMERETAEGKMLIDAAKAAGASRIIWSGLMSVTKLSGGKYRNAVHFDGKAAVTEYGRQCGVPFVDVQAGFYASNFLDNSAMLSKQDDGSFAIAWPVKPTTVVPVIDTAHDYGLFVRKAVELPVVPDGLEILTCGEGVMAKDLAVQLSAVTGKKIVYKQVPVKELGQRFASIGLPPHIVADMEDAFASFEEFGHYGGKAASSPEGLGRPLRTFREFVELSDWSKVLA